MDIKGLFTREAIARRLKQSEIIKTPVMDTIFTYRPELPFSVVSSDMVKRVVKTMPVIKRGGSSIALNSGSGSLAFYEPFPLSLNDTVSAKELNDLKVLNQSGREQWAALKQDFMRRTFRKSSESICAASLKGKFEFPAQIEGGKYEKWFIDFGNTIKMNMSEYAVWTADTKIADVFKLLTDMDESIQDNGFNDIEIWAGKTAYSMLVSICEAVKTTAKIKVEVTKEGIDIAGYFIKRRSESYFDPETNMKIPVIPEREIKMIAKDAGHMMPYCAIDDIDANLNAMPMFIKALKIDDPSGYKLIGQSKPFPIPNVDGICDAVVVA